MRKKQWKVVTYQGKTLIAESELLDKQNAKARKRGLDKQRLPEYANILVRVELNDG